MKHTKYENEEKKKRKEKIITFIHVKIDKSMILIVLNGKIIKDKL